MEFLRNSLVLLSITVLGMGCGNTVTRTDYIETDTYISSTDSINHSEEEVLKVSKNAQREDRIIIKLPTGKRDSDKNLKETLDSPAAIPLVPFIVFAEILQELLNCKSSQLLAEHLVNAQLIFDIQETEEAQLAQRLTLNLLEKPSWQSVTWQKAHPFSSQGRWNSPGGDVNPDFTSVASAHVQNTLVFDITAYFRELLSRPESVHYGMLIQSSAPELTPVRLVSTQSRSSSTMRPRVQSTYRCNRNYSLMPDAMESVFFRQNPHTFYLGNR